MKETVEPFWPYVAMLGVTTCGFLTSTSSGLAWFWGRLNETRISSAFLAWVNSHHEMWYITSYGTTSLQQSQEASLERWLPPGSESCSTSLSDLWEVYDLFYDMCQFLLLYMAWHKHNNILLQCYVDAWSLWRYFNIVILQVCCMLESSVENKCLRISGSGTQASIFFKVFQMNSMWNQVLYESISEQMEVKIWPPCASCYQCR